MSFALLLSPGAAGDWPENSPKSRAERNALAN